MGTGGKAAGSNATGRMRLAKEAAQGRTRRAADRGGFLMPALAERV